jgi:hypothetical protein
MPTPADGRCKPLKSVAAHKDQALLDDVAMLDGAALMGGSGYVNGVEISLYQH